MMQKLKKVKWKHFANYIVIAIFTAVFACMSMAGSVPASTLYLLEKMAISIILAVSLSLVVGFLGELSLGHAGFMCVGAYIGGKISVLLAERMGNNPLSMLLSLAVGGLAAAACGAIIGLPALRLKGDYLAIVTLAFGEIVRSLFLNSDSATFGGAMGMTTARYDKNVLFIYAFIAVLITLAVIQNLIRSRHGRAITAIRDSEIAAKATGINVTKYKMLAFILSAFFAGIAGVFYSYSNYTVQSSNFDYNYSIQILVMVVLGGMGSINGAIVSAALITFLNAKLPAVLTGNLAVLQNLIYALILIVIVIYNNAPALKGFREKYNLRRVFEKLVPPSKDPATRKDDEASWERVPTKINMDELLSMDIRRASDNAEERADENKGGK